MRITVDEVNDALYFRLDESLVVESEEVQPGIILDYDERGQTIGIEILGIKKRIPAGELKKLQFESV
ncbi:MAG: hypothetical protein A2Z29_05070 [Chloroflexi bacterium RBG_16_56_11]|nr:MAG: hypothetical protein A2Z29_05070 [Chloroflexi bacterium RBG_16_56_11]